MLHPGCFIFYIHIIINVQLILIISTPIQQSGSETHSSFWCWHFAGPKPLPPHQIPTTTSCHGTSTVRGWHCPVIKSDPRKVRTTLKRLMLPSCCMSANLNSLLSLTLCCHPILTKSQKHGLWILHKVSMLHPCINVTILDTLHTVNHTQLAIIWSHQTFDTDDWLHEYLKQLDQSDIILSYCEELHQLCGVYKHHLPS